MKLTKAEKELLVKMLHSPESIKKRTAILQGRDHFRKAINSRWSKKKLSTDKIDNT